MAELDILLKIVLENLLKDGKTIGEREETKRLIKEHFPGTELLNIRDSYVKYLSGNENSFRDHEKRLSLEFIREAFLDVYHYSVFICQLVSGDS